jgi:hypothetical protein
MTEQTPQITVSLYQTERFHITFHRHDLVRILDLKTNEAVVMSLNEFEDSIAKIK